MDTKKNDGTRAVEENQLLNVPSDDKNIKTDAPSDWLNIVYVIFILHGIGTLMPWNMFINANEYFVQYKLKPADLIVPNITSNGTIPQPRTVYQIYFLNVLGLVALIPNVLLNAINIFCRCKGGETSVRVVGSILIVVVMFVLTVVLAMMDTSQWPEGFFWITMTTVVFINMANGIYQNSMFGAAAILPMKYTNAVVLGSNLSGTITAVINLITLAGTPDYRASAVYFFLTAIFVLVIAFDAFLMLDLLPFYQYQKKKMVAASSSDGDDNQAPPYLRIFKKCWIHFASVFFVFFVTLTCFPAILAGTEVKNPDFFISPRYFSAITCFLFFNLFAFVGNIVSSFIQIPGPRWLWIPVLARALFIPFFMFCNVTPQSRRFPVLIGNEYVYCIGSVLFGFTSGYFSSLAMMYSPRNVEGSDKAVAGMMASFFLVLGLLGGILFSTPVKLLIESGN